MLTLVNAIRFLYSCSNLEIIHEKSETNYQIEFALPPLSSQLRIKSVSGVLPDTKLNSHVDIDS